MMTELTYAPAGVTYPGDPSWPVLPGFLRFEQTVVIGHGDEFWHRTAEEVLRWGVKRRSGFRVALCGGAQVPPPGSAELRVRPGADFRITASWGPFAVHEPARVVAVVEAVDRCGFAYGTLPGHPVSGEEAFIVHRDAEGTVFLTLRSLTRPAPKGPWRWLFRPLLVAQRFYRRRYLTVMVARPDSPR